MVFGHKELETDPSTIWRLVSDVKEYHILEKYEVNGVHITITTDGKYIINEPVLDLDAQSSYDKIFEHMGRNAENFDYADVSENQVIESFEKSGEILELSDVVNANLAAMSYYLIRDTMGFRIIDVLMRDNNLEDITCENYNTPVGVIHRKYPEFFVMDTNILFGNPDDPRNSLETFTKILMQKTGNYATSVSPYVEGSTPKRDRLSAFAGDDITPDGPAFTIRRFPEKPITIIDLIDANVIPTEAAAYVWSIFAGSGTGMIVGNTGSGKTTILNALLSVVNKRWKVILIEDTEEVRVPQKHTLRLKTRSSTDSFNKDYSIGIGDLLIYSLRQRPQFVVVGEVRLTDVPILFQVYETGHASLSTFHASSPAKALVRLEAKPIEIMAAQKDDLWFLLHVGRVLEGGQFKRKMLSLVETRLNADGTLSEVTVMSYNSKTKSFDGTNLGDMAKNSERLQYAASLNGITDIESDLKEKVDCLNSLKLKNPTHDEIMNAISASQQ